jgi:hypothetical protein
MTYEQKTPNIASRTSTGMTLAPPARAGVMHWTLGTAARRDGVPHASCQAVFYASAFSRSDGFAPSAPAPVTQAVETVEKVPFRKLIFGKWDKNIEKRLVFCVPNNILAIFEPVVGDFCEDFSSKEFFDSLVGQMQEGQV